MCLHHSVEVRCELDFSLLYDQEFIWNINKSKER